MITILRTLITYLCWAVIGVFFGLLTFPFVLLPASVRYDMRWYYRLWSWAAWLQFKAAGIKVVVTGREKLPAFPEQPTIFAMNHASAIDIFAMEKILGSYPRIWISRMAYKYIPLLGTIMRRMQVVVDLTSPRAAVRALARMVELGRNAKRHLLIFPEGGRFTDGSIRSFFRGYVIMARKLNRPVVPIYIGNAHKVFHPQGYLINNAYPLTLTIGEPFVLGTDETDEQFNERVRDWFVQQAEAFDRDAD